MPPPVTGMPLSQPVGSAPPPYTVQPNVQVTPIPAPSIAPLPPPVTTLPPLQ
jgi:hypothetical protein